MKGRAGGLGFPGTGRIPETQRDSGTFQPDLQVQRVVSRVQPCSQPLGISASQDRLGVVSREMCRGLSLRAGARVTVFGDNKRVSPRNPRHRSCSPGCQVRLGVHGKQVGIPRAPHCRQLIPGQGLASVPVQDRRRGTVGSHEGTPHPRSADAGVAGCPR